MAGMRIYGGLGLMAMGGALLAPSAQAERGVVIDSAAGQAYVFDTGSNQVVSTISAVTPGASENDCAITEDNQKAYVTDVGGIATLLLDSATTGDTIRLPYTPIELTLTPDSRYLLSSGAGVNDPLTVFATANGMMTSRLVVPPGGPYYAYGGVKWTDVCDDGTTVIGGFSDGYADHSSLYRFSLSPTGQIRSTAAAGARVGYGGNGYCAAGGGTAVVMASYSGFGATRVDTMTVVPYQQRFSAGGFVESGALAADGKTVFLRTTSDIEAWGFNPVTGVLAAEASWVRPTTTTGDPYTDYEGPEVLAISKETGKLYFGDGGALKVMNPDGSLDAAIPTGAGRLTGVCLAK